MASLRIGELADQSGTSTPTIRYYESIGLLPPAGRLPSGQRIYAEVDAARLLFIRRCREFGFSIDQVRTLIDVANTPDRSCVEVRTIAEDHLRSIREKLRELRALEAAMATFADSCTTTCVGGPGPACVPLANLVHARSGAGQ